MWDGNFAPILLFGTDEYLIGDAKNIVYSLLRMAMLQLKSQSV